MIVTSKYHFLIKGSLEKRKTQEQPPSPIRVKTDREHQYQNNEYSGRDLKWDIKQLYQNIRMPVNLSFMLKIL